MSQVVVDILNRIPKMMRTALLYQERCYQLLAKCLLEEAGFKCSIENICEYKIEGHYVGYGRIDIIAKRDNEMYIIEMKANVGYQQTNKAKCQLKRYMIHYKTKRKLTGILCMYNVGGSPVKIFVINPEK